ncbi:MAG: hypothetical protein RR776_04840, partial [Niameybacter sp.]|uniref:hypothetical protein n=1 Tax=Niameybacter sp. TaxID=2033640 RepID=UPI002FC75225
NKLSRYLMEIITVTTSYFKVGIFDELDALYPDTDASSVQQFYQVHSASNSFAGTHLMTISNSSN